MLVALATTAHASKPIPWTMKGCVLDGVFYDVDNDGAGIVRAMGKPIDTSKLAGKYIEVEGLLYPGDYFRASDKPPVVRRDCSDAEKKLVEYAKAHEMRLEGGRLADAGKVDEALKLVDKAIKLVQPADCDTYIDRAHLYTRKDEHAAAARDVTVLVARKCRYRGALNWLLLRELGTEMRQRKRAKTAVTVLELAAAHCDAEICRPEIEKELAAARAAAKR